MKRLFRRRHTIRRVLCALLAAAMAVSPSATVFAQTNAAQQAVRQRVEGLGQTEEPEAPREQPAAPRTTPAKRPAARPGSAIDTRYIAPGAAAVIVLRPAQLMKSPLLEMLPTEVATAAGLKYVGFDPADVDELSIFADMANPASPPSYALTLHFNKPFKGASIPKERRAHAQLGELNGKKYLQSQQPMLPSFYGPNNQTLIVAPDETLRQLVQAEAESSSGPLLDRVSKAQGGSDLYIAIDIAALRPIVGMYLPMIQGQAPPEAQAFFDLPNLISALELTVNLSGPGPTSLVAHANDEAAAEQVMTLINDAVQKYQTNLKAHLAEQAASEDPVERAFAQYGERVSSKSITPLLPTREGATLTLFHSDGLDESQKKMLIAGVGIAAGALLPATMAARDAARRSQSMNNHKQIVLAFLNHESATRALPAHAIYGADDKPLLSWRVKILPFIEQQALYEQFHLNEPWDSEHNKTLIAQMPQVYANPNLKLEPGKTNYLALVGADCVLDGTKTGLGLRNITDGTSNTIAVVEADPAQAVEWTKPDDLEFDPNDPKAGLGNVQPGGWIAAFCDGHVEFIAEQIDPQMLKAYITKAGGEAMQPNMAPAPAAAVIRVE